MRYTILLRCTFNQLESTEQSKVLTQNSWGYTLQFQNLANLLKIYRLSSLLRLYLLSRLENRPDSWVETMTAKKISWTFTNKSQFLITSAKILLRMILPLEAVLMPIHLTAIIGISSRPTKVLLTISCQTLETKLVRLLIGLLTKQSRLLWSTFIGTRMFSSLRIWKEKILEQILQAKTGITFVQCKD